MDLVQDIWLWIIWGVLLQSQILCSQNLICDSNDLRALEDFMNGLQLAGEGWRVNRSINCCDWPGVICNSSTSLGLKAPPDSGRVVGLLLGSKRLAGHISDSLGLLDQLRVLNLSHNLLNGKLPSSVFYLPNLESLDLSYNDFNGKLPESVDLPSIQLLDISLNSFSGFLPVAICANSSRLRILNLSDNYFNGTIPSGFGNCSSMEELSLGTNDLTGNIHADIFQLQRLVWLDFSENRFSGNIPDYFQNMKSLQFFIVRSNQFTGPIPPSLSNLGSVVFLNLRNNSLTGKIVLNCSAMTSLERLDLAINNFTGPLPSNLPDCRRLRNINLVKNNFGGQIPDNFKNFQRLEYLSLSNCSLSNVSSALRILQQCSSLTYLVLTKNFYAEDLPSEPSLNFSKLKVLIIACGRLRGTIPGWLNKCTNLQLLDLSWDSLCGSIPVWFGDFPSLFYLDLSNNSLTGAIPKALTNLWSLIVPVDMLEDPLPDFTIFLKRNENMSGYQYNKVFSLPPTLDLSYNSLTGSIWPEFGKLKRLHILHLRNNFLSGPIPDELSGMISLEAMDLSHNNLSGTLPSSLGSLTFLSMFSVAYNNLNGPIPGGTQFDTFPVSSFEGNHLCGFHAAPCRLDRPSTYPTDTSLLPDESSHSDFVDGMAVGLTAGFSGAVIFSIVSWSMTQPKRGRVGPYLKTTYFAVRFFRT